MLLALKSEEGKVVFSGPHDSNEMQIQVYFALQSSCWRLSLRFVHFAVKAHLNSSFKQLMGGWEEGTERISCWIPDEVANQLRLTSVRQKQFLHSHQTEYVSLLKWFSAAAKKQVYMLTAGRWESLLHKKRENRSWCWRWWLRFAICSAPPVFSLILSSLLVHSLSPSRPSFPLLTFTFPPPLIACLVSLKLLIHNILRNHDDDDDDKYEGGGCREGKLFGSIFSFFQNTQKRITHCSKHHTFACRVPVTWCDVTLTVSSVTEVYVSVGAWIVTLGVLVQRVWKLSLSLLPLNLSRFSFRSSNDMPHRCACSEPLQLKENSICKHIHTDMEAFSERLEQQMRESERRCWRWKKVKSGITISCVPQKWGRRVFSQKSTSFNPPSLSLAQWKRRAQTEFPDSDEQRISCSLMHVYMATAGGWESLVELESSFKSWMRVVCRCCLIPASLSLVIYCYCFSVIICNSIRSGKAISVSTEGKTSIRCKWNNEKGSAITLFENWKRVVEG